MAKEKDILADTSVANLSKPRFTSHLILWLALIFFVAAFFWAKYAKLDEATVAQGKVVPSSQIQVIQNLEGGIVQQILVREGDNVEQDQILMYIDDTQFLSAYQEGMTRALTLRAEIARLKAQASGEELNFPEALEKEAPKIISREQVLYNTEKIGQQTREATLHSQLVQKQQQLKELEERQKQLQRSSDLVQEELALTAPLVKEGAVSKVELLRLQRTANDTLGELNSTKLAIPRIEAELKEAENKIAEVQSAFRTEKQQELNDVREGLSSLQQQNKALQDRVARAAVRSPVNGTVAQIYVNTVGGVIQPGMDLMEIVPANDTLLIEAYINPADIAFLHPGQRALVKITAYDFSIYGGLEGTVEHISADTVESEEGVSQYEVRIRTQKNHLGTKANPLPIIPGMMATVDIMTGQKSVLDYLLKPILKTQQNALRER